MGKIGAYVRSGSLTLSLSQHSNSNRHATYISTVQPPPYTEMSSDVHAKANKCSGIANEDDKSTLLQMTWAILLSLAPRNIQLSVNDIPKIHTPHTTAIEYRWHISRRGIARLEI